MCTDSTLIRFEGVFVSLMDSKKEDATAVQLDGEQSLLLVTEDSFKTSMCLVSPCLHRHLLSVHTECWIFARAEWLRILSQMADVIFEKIRKSAENFLSLFSNLWQIINLKYTNSRTFLTIEKMQSE